MHVIMTKNTAILSRTLPEGCIALGIIDHAVEDNDDSADCAGVLVQMTSTGEYRQVNEGKYRTEPFYKIVDTVLGRLTVPYPAIHLDQAAVAECIADAMVRAEEKGPGRKAKDGAKGLMFKGVNLDQHTMDICLRVGDGNLSLGIRRMAINYAANVK